jgi:hypothetical protein
LESGLQCVKIINYGFCIRLLYSEEKNSERSADFSGKKIVYRLDPGPWQNSVSRTEGRRHIFNRCDRADVG